MNLFKRLRALLVAVAVMLGCLGTALVVGAGTASARPCDGCNDGGGGSGAPTLPKMAQYSVSWSNFGSQTCYTSGDQTLCGYTPPTLHGDSIDVAQTTGQPGYITIVLTTAPAVTWYKEIKAFDVYGRTLGWISTSDAAHGPVSMTLPASQVAALVFTKAGFLGIHVGQYDLRNVASKAGYVETFNWTRDS